MDDWVTQRMADIAADELRTEDSPVLDAIVDSITLSLQSNYNGTKKILEDVGALPIDFDELSEEDMREAVMIAFRKAGLK